MKFANESGRPILMEIIKRYLYSKFIQPSGNFVKPLPYSEKYSNKIKMDIDNHGGLDKKKEKQDLTKSDVDTKREKIGGKTFSESIETTDKDFMQKNLENKTTNTFKMPDSVINNSKIPKKYIQFIERTLNTQKNTKDGTNYSDYFGLAYKK